MGPTQGLLQGTPQGTPQGHQIPFSCSAVDTLLWKLHCRNVRHHIQGVPGLRLEACEANDWKECGASGSKGCDNN